MFQRHYNALDRLIMEFDRKLGSVKSPVHQTPRRQSPAVSVDPVTLKDTEKRLSEGLMRVNHSGEVSAQALYQGQALTSQSPRVRTTMQQSAQEEIDHLAWCEARIRDLDGRTSYLNPLWYSGSFIMGVLAGLAGDKWSLGFVAETERQVVLHLQEHLSRLPAGDSKSRVIIQQMMEDEAHHGSVALDSGGVELPEAIKKAMRFCSRLMTRTAYWI